MPNRSVWSFVSIAESDNDDSANIFVFKKVVDGTDGTVLGDFFLGIASMDQLDELHNTTSNDPLYLTNVVEIDTRSDDEREVVIGNIDYSIEIFNANKAAWDVLREAEDYAIEAS